MCVGEIHNPSNHCKTWTDVTNFQAVSWAQLLKTHEVGEGWRRQNGCSEPGSPEFKFWSWYLLALWPQGMVCLNLSEPIHIENGNNSKLRIYKSFSTLNNKNQVNEKAAWGGGGCGGGSRRGRMRSRKRRKGSRKHYFLFFLNSTNFLNSSS